MFRVRFAPYSSNVSHALSCHRVYSSDINDILLFMKQHSFDQGSTNIETLPDSYCEDDVERNMLKFYKMKSNRTNQVYNIMTTEYFVDEAVESVACSLGSYLVFGPIITRREVPFINVINDIIDEIPFIFAFDYNIMEGGPAIDCEYFVVKKDMDQFLKSEEREYDGSTLDELYNRFLFKVIPGEPLPITLEGYIRCFVKRVVTNKGGPFDG